MLNNRVTMGDEAVNPLMEKKELTYKNNRLRTRYSPYYVEGGSGSYDPR